MIFIVRMRAESKKNMRQTIAFDFKRSDALTKLFDANKISVKSLRFKGRFQQTKRLTDQSDSIDSIVAFLKSFRIDKI